MESHQKQALTKAATILLTTLLSLPRAVWGF
jgi:hypothetical protein